MEDPTVQAERLAEFCSVTGAESDRARLYLESTAWNLQLALSSFYEETDNEVANMNEDNIPSFSSGHSEPPPPIPKLSPPPVAKSASGSSRIATLSSLAKEDNPEEEGQAFYAGGSERSGQQVLGPSKKKDSNDIVAEMFKAAKSHGAQVLDPSEMMQSSKPSRFIGTGYRLGSNEGDTQMVSGSQPTESPVTMVLKMWQNGFSVDDGPLELYDDPSNRDFLESIRRGEVPQELSRRARGEVNLNMEDHRHEDFIVPRKKVAAFTGEGHRLGSVTPPVLSGHSKVDGDQSKNEEAAKRLIEVDPSKPITNIQIRLVDGSRLVTKLNHSHTVGDIRRYIVTARPEYAATMFGLLTTFPHQELCDDSISLKDANLLNAVIVQRLK